MSKKQSLIHMSYAIMLLVLAVLIAAAFVVFVRQPEPTVESTASRVTEPDFPPKPKWKPTVPVDIERIVKTFSYYTDGMSRFVVFRHGTCVMIPAEATDEVATAKDILNKVYYYHPDFNPQVMDDGNFMVSFSQPAYAVVFQDEFEANKDYIHQNHLDGIVEAEVLLNAKGDSNQFDDRGKIGLFGRSRMFLDAQQPKIVKVMNP